MVKNTVVITLVRQLQACGSKSAPHISGNKLNKNSRSPYRDLGPPMILWSAMQLSKPRIPPAKSLHERGMIIGTVSGPRYAQPSKGSQK